MTVDGLTTIASMFGTEEALKRLKAEIEAHGMSIFACVDHAARQDNHRYDSHADCRREPVQGKAKARDARCHRGHQKEQRPAIHPVRREQSIQNHKSRKNAAYSNSRSS